MCDSHVWSRDSSLSHVNLMIGTRVWWGTWMWWQSVQACDQHSGIAGWCVMGFFTMSSVTKLATGEGIAVIPAMAYT